MINLTILSHYIRFRKPRGRYVTINMDELYLHRPFFEVTMILCLIPYFILSATSGMVGAAWQMVVGYFLLILGIYGVWFCLVVMLGIEAEGGGGGGHHRMVYNHTTGKIEHHIQVGRIPQEKKKQ
jgi:Na+(H+)/acetate symporter ActP